MKIKNTLIVIALILCAGLKAETMPRIVYQNGKANYSIVWDNKIAKITDLMPEIKVNGKWISASDFEVITWEKRTGKRLSEANHYNHPVEMLYLTCSGHPILKKFTLAFELMHERPYVVINSELIASKEFLLGGIRIFNSKGSNILLPGNSKDWIIFNENAATPHTPAMMYPYQLRTSHAKIGKYSKAHTGVWLSLLVNDKKNYTFSFASISGELWPNNFKWQLPIEGDNNHLKLSARSGAIFEKEQIIVNAGKTIVTDAFMVCFRDDVRPTQAMYETGVVMGQNVRKGKTMRRPQPGWSSWHSYSRNITEKEIIDAANFIKENLDEYGWKNIQLDGGWWTNPGLYTVKNDFPHGIRYISNYVTKNGQEFGLHISPLRTNTTDAVVSRHKDWILQPYKQQKIDKNDDEMITTLGTVYFDASHPEVPSFLAGRYQQMVEDYRPLFMKWDHAYGALEEGKRKDPTMTSLQAHNKAIREIRNSLPKNLIITRSMNYLLGAVECFDAIRIGNDINRPGIKSEKEPWANMTYGKTLGSIEDEQVEKGLIRFARQVARNFFIHNNIGIADPDAFFVSPQYTIDEAKCHMTLQAIMGGLFFTGDRINSLPKERLDLLKNRSIMQVNKIGKHAVPLDLFSGIDIPTIWKLEADNKIIITVFNWSDKENDRTFDFKKDFELNQSKYNMTELWSQEKYSFKRGKINLKMAPHSVKIFELTQK